MRRQQREKRVPGNSRNSRRRGRNEVCSTCDLSIRMMPTWGGGRLRGFAGKLELFAILRIDWDRVPKTRVVLSREEDGSCPFIEWFDKLPAKVQDKCYLRLERLREMGHELRRPEADFLRDGIYELRVSLGGVHHRILYFLHGAMATVLSRSCERAGGPAERHRSRRRTQETV